MGKMTRSEARESAFLVLFQSSYEVCPSEELIQSLEENHDIKCNSYSKRCIFGVNGNLDKINSFIESESKNWNLDRISRVALVSIRLALYELLFEKGITPGISFSEYVTIARKYSDKDTAAFVNGILGGIYKNHKDEIDGYIALKNE